MRDTISLLIATAILAVGGLGMYIYKPSNEKQDGDDGYVEDSLFCSGGFRNLENDLEDEEPEYYEPKAKSRGGKTKRSRKNFGTKRRY